MSPDSRDKDPVQPPIVAFGSEPPQKLLFLCVHNSARSQMAEALAHIFAPPDTEIWSAGSEPTEVHRLAIDVMKEVGLDLSGHRSKSVDDVPWRDADTIVTVCAEADEKCPVVPSSVRRVRWLLPDPVTAPEKDRLRAFRETRDELRWRVSCLWPRGD